MRKVLDRLEAGLWLAGVLLWLALRALVIMPVEFIRQWHRDRTGRTE